MVLPTNSGGIVLDRAQVLTIVLSLAPKASTFLASLKSTNGPFLSERLIPYLLFPSLRPLTINLLVLFRLLVLYPRVFCPHGVFGAAPWFLPPPTPCRPPSPPPCGWSTAFMTTPRTEGLMPLLRFRPALPILTFWCCSLPTMPIEAVQFSLISRTS